VLSLLLLRLLLLLLVSIRCIDTHRYVCLEAGLGVAARRGSLFVV
jgi:hypothetical protein